MIIAKVPESKVKEYTEFYNYKKYIAISWIGVYYFCPYQLYLERVKRIKVEATEKMKAGTMAHKVREISHEMRVEEEISIEDALFLSKMEGNVYVFREVPFNSKFREYQLGAKLDELIIYPDHVEIVDDKSGDYVYDSAKMQVRGYALAFQERFKPERRIELVIRNVKSGEENWREEYGEEQERIVKEKLHEIYLLLKDIVIPVVEPNPRKCASCRFKEYCEYYREMEENSNKGH